MRDPDENPPIHPHRVIVSLGVFTVLNAAADRDQHLLGVVLDQPRRVRGVPVIRLFDLPAVVDRLFEEPILVFDAVPEAAMSNVAIESMKQAAKRPNPPLPRAASGSSSIMRSKSNPNSVTARCIFVSKPILIRLLRSD